MREPIYHARQVDHVLKWAVSDDQSGALALGESAK